MTDESHDRHNIITLSLPLFFWWLFLTCDALAGGSLQKKQIDNGVSWVRICPLDRSVLGFSLVGNIWVDGNLTRYLFNMSGPAGPDLPPWSILQWLLSCGLHLYGCYRLGQWQCKVRTIHEESSRRQGPLRFDNDSEVSSTDAREPCRRTTPDHCCSIHI